MADTMVNTVQLPSGNRMPVLGQGTWGMGEQRARRSAEVKALQRGLDLGMNLIDTAEMYGEGGAEEVVAEVMADRRAEVYLVSKVYPHNAGRRSAIEACERSLRRLKTDYLDLYLLHWPGSIPLDETVEAFRQLKEEGKIRDYGVSNFDTDDMEEVFSVPGGEGVVTNQVLYNLLRRGIEWDLLPWCRQHAMPIMAYSPIENSGKGQRAILENPVVEAIARSLNVTPAQVALAWLLHQEGVVVIPKASSEAHVRENRGAFDIRLTGEQRKELDRAFPPPQRKVGLAMR